MTFVKYICGMVLMGAMLVLMVPAAVVGFVVATAWEGLSFGFMAADSFLKWMDSLESLD